MDYNLQNRPFKLLQKDKFQYITPARCNILARRIKIDIGIISLYGADKLWNCRTSKCWKVYSI